MLIIFFPTISFPALGRGAPDDLLKSGTFLGGLILLIVAVLGLLFYISTVLHIGNVTSVLEEKYYSLAAVVKSIDLLVGKGMTVFALFTLNVILGGAIGNLFWYAVIDGRSRGVGITARAATLLCFFVGILLVGLLCFVSVMGLLALIVLYFVLHLAIVISVLEEKNYGLAAMVKSSDLLKGKRMTALTRIFGEVIEVLFRYAVIKGRSHGVGITARTVYGILLVGSLCFVNLMGLLTQSVLYFVCKAYHHENIHDNSSIKVEYNVGDYEPMITSNS